MLDDKKVTYFRTYKNILNIFADIGGLMKVLMTIGAFIAKPIS